MMLTIHGLPATIKYHELKQLIKHECNIADFILDSLVKDDQGPGKKMKIGVANDAEGSILIRCLDGFQVEGHALRVVPVGQAAAPPKQPPSYGQQQSYANAAPAHQDFAHHQGHQRPWPSQGYQYQGSMDYQTQQSQPKSFGMESYARAQAATPMQQNYGYQPKHQELNKNQERSHVLRNIEILDTPIQPSRTPYRDPPDRPMTIAKDTFQGSSFCHGSSGVTPWAHDQVPQKPQESYSKPIPQYDSRPNYDNRNPDPKRGMLKPAEPYARDTVGPNSSFPKDEATRKNFDPKYRDSYPRKDFDEPNRGDFPRKDEERKAFRDNYTRKDFEPVPGREFPKKDDVARKPQTREQYPRKDFDPPIRGGDFARKQDVGRKFDAQNRGEGFRKEFEPQSHRDNFPRKDFGVGGDFSKKEILVRKDYQGGSFDRDEDKRVFQADRINIRDDLFAREHQQGGKDVKRDEMPRKAPFGRDEPVRRISPRRKSPAGPLRSPTRREGIRRPSPVRRSSRDNSPRKSPPRRRSPPPMRYSPSDSFPTDSYADTRPQSKQVRPAYDTAVQNQPIYSGSFRPNANENVQYPVQGRSQPSKWQENTNTYAKKPDEDRRDFARSTFEKPTRRSRSPIHGDRSPLRRRNSPSRSPRRSWALEKRRSPEFHDAPPPPSWPGQSNIRSKFPERCDKDEKRSFPGFRGQEPPRQLDAKRRDEPETSDVWKPKRNRSNEDFNRSGDNVRRSDDYPREAGRPDDRRKDERDFFPNRSNDFRKVPDLYRKEDYRKDPEPKRPDDYRKDIKMDTRPDDYHRYNHDKADDRPGFHKKPVSPLMLKQQRDKAAKKIADGICERHKVKDSRVYDELKLVLTLKMNTTFGDRDVEATDLLAWFYQRYNSMEQDEMFNDVLDSLQRQAKLKRPSEDIKPDVATSEHEPPRKTTKTEQVTQKDIVKAKYKMTIETIRNRILKENNLKPANNVDFKRIVEELTMVILRLLLKFGEKYGPSCDIMRKYTTSYTKLDEEKMLQDVLKKIRDEKKATGVSSNVPSKSAKASTSTVNLTDVQSGGREQLQSRWDIPGKVELYIPQQQQNLQLASYYQQSIPVAGTDPLYLLQQQMPAGHMSMQQVGQSGEEYLCNLYLCKDDFGVITHNEANALKDFLVAQIFEETASKGWAPNFTLKGLKSLYRYEVATNDSPSRDWLTNLDFSKFSYFNVLVYNKEELWFERAAIWLPGHSKYRFLEPLMKLQLQNKNVPGLNIDKWKLVKRIDHPKGTRIYVDMPPASARALEAQKMLLSYELQKVNVFLKAIAVDKDAFDLGLKDKSVTDNETIAVDNAPLPFLSDSAHLVKICLKGNKLITPNQAKKIKEILISKIFKYHQESFAKCRTDFVKFGFCQPGYFLVEPENEESKKWLTRLVDIGKLNKHEIVVVGEDPIKYLSFWTVIYKTDTNLNGPMVLERIKHCNRIVQGLHFPKWQVAAFSHMSSRNARLDLQIDLESVETLKKLHFRLDYKNSNIKLKHHYKNLDETIRNLKSEMVDSYDVANMELDNSDDEDVVCLD